jgi:hypothetical protein
MRGVQISLKRENSVSLIWFAFNMEDIITRVKAITGVVGDTVTEEVVTKLVDFMVTIPEDEEWTEAIGGKQAKPVTDADKLKFMVDTVLDAGLKVEFRLYTGAGTLYEGDSLKATLSTEETKALMKVYRGFLRLLIVATLANDTYGAAVTRDTRVKFPFFQSQFLTRQS